MSKTGNRTSAGFTLIELMITVAVLSMGTVMIQQGFLRSSSVLDRLSSSLKIQSWMDERIWEAKERLFYSESASLDNQGGDFTDSGRLFHWLLEVQPVSDGKDLYQIHLSVNWTDGNGAAQMARTVFATSMKKPGEP